MPELQPFGRGGGNFVSPGGFEFGLQGWSWAEPVVRSVTFFLDGTALVADQYGRPIKGLALDSGEVVLFAPSPPEDSMERDVRARPHYATHAQVVAALFKDLRVDLIGEMNSTTDPCTACKGRGVVGERRCVKCAGNGKKQTVTCAGWPQLSYEQLKQLRSLPATMERDLLRIPDAALRKTALRVRREDDAARVKETTDTE